MDTKRGFIPFVLGLFLAWVPLAGCYYVGPAPVVVEPGPAPSFDFAWDNALRAADETGIQITSANKETGTMIGQRGSVAVNIRVMKQHDGRIRVELDLKSQQPRTKYVADDFYKAYDRYLGRRQP